MLTLLRLIIWTVVAISAASLASIAGIYLYLAPNVASIDGLCGARLETPLRVYSSDQKLIKVFGEKRRTPVRFQDVPPRFVQAMLAAEDDRFLYHYGVDIPGLLRAAAELLTTGEIRSGGSTITMQVAKNCLLSNERTFRRKFNEILLALQIEREMTKEQILELYFNVIFLGKRAHGVQAAAERYYGRPIDQLELAQMAMIAGLPKAPSLFNPIVNPKRALHRRDWILGRMFKLGYISREDYEQARKAPSTARIHDFEDPEIAADYLAEMVRDWMYERYGEQTYTEGFKVITSVDSRLQEDANRALRAGLLEYDRRHGYRGAEGRVKVPAGADPADIALLERLLAGRQPVNGLLPGIVLAVAEKSAKVWTAEGVVELDWKALSWARRYINEDSLGEKPSTAADVLATGEIVRVERAGEGRHRLAQVPKIQGALVGVASETGAVRALVGGFHFDTSKFNRAVQARRQPGSTFKPFIYAAALESGITAGSIFNDAPVVESFDATSQNTYVLNNASGVNLGPTRMRVGLYKSVNTVSARVLQAVGIGKTLGYLERIGFNTAGMPRNLQLSVGGGTMELSPLEVATHYAKLANGGHLVESWFIDRVLARDGSEIYRAEPLVVCPACLQKAAVPAAAVAPGDAPVQAEMEMDEGGDADEVAAADADSDTAPVAGVTAEPAGPEPAAPAAWQVQQAPRVMDPRAVYILNSMMRDVIQHGTGRAARVLGRQDIAGKTGTTDDARNLWFSGFNAKFVATAWVGFDEETPLGKREYGATAALPIWIRFMREALRDQPEATMRQPDGILNIRIDPDSGEAAPPGSSRGVFEMFIEGTEPEPPIPGVTHPDAPDGGSRPELLF